jgi:hypothetical protein
VWVPGWAWRKTRQPAQTLPLARERARRTCSRAEAASRPWISAKVLCCWRSSSSVNESVVRANTQLLRGLPASPAPFVLAVSGAVVRSVGVVAAPLLRRREKRDGERGGTRHPPRHHHDGPRAHASDEPTLAGTHSRAS